MGAELVGGGGEEGRGRGGGGEGDGEGRGSAWVLLELTDALHDNYM